MKLVGKSISRQAKCLLRPLGRQVRRAGVAALGLLALVAGCSSKHYQKAADREAYKIVGQGQTKVFGHTNAFTIETPYTARDPQKIMPPELIEERAQVGPARVLSIEEALSLAANSSRRYQTEKEKLYLLALSVSDARHVFQPNPFSDSIGKIQRVFVNTDNINRSRELYNKVGATTYLKSGASLGMSVANDVLRYYTGNGQSKIVSTLSANITQPLLRGVGRMNPNVELLTQTERNLIYGVRSFSYFQNSFSVEVLNDYFNLLAQKDVLRNRYTNYLSRVKSTRRLEARVVDRERLTDVDQARQAELSARVSYVSATTTYLNALDDFKVKLGLTVQDPIQLDDRPLDELQARGPLPVAVPRDEAYRLGVERHMDVLNEIDRYEDSQRKILFYANRLKADLNIFANAELDSNAPKDYTRFNSSRINTTLGVELKLPLDRLAERNDYRAALISFEAELRNLKLRLDTLKQAIERGLRNLEQRRQNYAIQSKALELANRRVASVTMLLEAGRAEVRDLVEAQDAQIAAQNAVTSELVAYQQAQLQLLLDMGIIETDSPHFWLKDQLAGVYQHPPSPPAAEPNLVAPNQLFGETP